MMDGEAGDHQVRRLRTERRPERLRQVRETDLAPVGETGRRFPGAFEHGGRMVQQRRSRLGVELQQRPGEQPVPAPQVQDPARVRTEVADELDHQAELVRPVRDRAAPLLQKLPGDAKVVITFALFHSALPVTAS